MRTSEMQKILAKAYSYLTSVLGNSPPAPRPSEVRSGREVQALREEAPDGELPRIQRQIQADDKLVQRLEDQLADAKRTIWNLQSENALNEFRARHRKRERDFYRHAVRNARFVVFKATLLRQRHSGRQEKIELIERSGLFDHSWYLKQCPDAGAQPINHYLWAGALEGLDPHPLFDTRWYLLTHRSARWSGENPLVHYLTYGWKEGRSPHPWFDVKWYLGQYPEVARSGEEPLAHFLSEGWQRGYQPHRLFDSVWYRNTYKHLLGDEKNPLVHFLTKGLRSGAQPNISGRLPEGLPPHDSPAGPVRSSNLLPMIKFEPAFIELMARSSPGSSGAHYAPAGQRQRRVGAMASFPPRKSSLQAAIASILPQLDELILYLNEYDSAPDFTDHPKIRVYLGKHEEGDIRDNGKFYALPKEENAYIFTLDDDIIYPKNYVERMTRFIEMLGRTTVVGVHGVVFPAAKFTRLQQRTVYDFREEASGHFVDLLGTGTTAWHNSTVRMSLEDFRTKGVCDLWFAAAALRQGVPLFSVPRERLWLREHRPFEKTLYNEALSGPNRYFSIYNRTIAPLLKDGYIRRTMEAHIARGFDSKALFEARAEESSMPEQHGSAASQAALIAADRPVLQAGARSMSKDLHFCVVVTGWNCRAYVAECLRSIANQEEGAFSHEVILVDDGSTDGTLDQLRASTGILPDARVMHLRKNFGPAAARHMAIQSIVDPDCVVVLVDMDDSLEPQALRTVAERYHKNDGCLMTIGNWHDQNDIVNPQGFYSADEIDFQRVREVEEFNATHLRSFRRKLYDAIRVEDLLDRDGRWIEACTDVALMYPLLDQCWSDEVEFIHTPIYRYRRKHSAGTVARFGRPYKIERLNYLKSKPSKPRLNARRPMDYAGAEPILRQG